MVRTSYPRGRRKAARGAKRSNSRENNLHNSYTNKGSSQQRRDQQRASVFRTRQESTRVTKLLDNHGNRRVIRQHGKMGLTKHASILAAFEMRALRYQHKGHAKADQDEILYNEAVDETGTIDTAELSDTDADSCTESLGEQYQINLTAATLEMEEITGISDEILEVHGIAPGRKAEGVSRLIYENIDGLNNRR